MNKKKINCKKAFIHVDMDSLESIYQVQGWKFNHCGDYFYETSVNNSLSFFEEHNVKATYFVVARDILVKNRKKAILKILEAGHNLASHSFSHPNLFDISLSKKRKEIFYSKELIEQETSHPIIGFRSPSYSVDHEVIELLGEAEYKYDSSFFSDFKFRLRSGINRLFPDPFVILPKLGLIEIPMPTCEPSFLPFHPTYAFVLSRLYHNWGLTRYSKHRDYLTYLFHLADFSEKPNVSQNLRQSIFVNERSWVSKRRFLNSIFKRVLERYQPITSEDFVNNWPKSAPKLNPKVILGVSTTHETSACIVKNGKILAAISEERLSRKKVDSAFPPKLSIEAVIRASNINPSEIEAVAISGLNWRSLLYQTFKSQKNDFLEYHSWIDYFPHFNKFLYRVYYFIRAVKYQEITKYLLKKYDILPKIFYIEHHEAHAWSAYATSGMDNVIVLTADGVGDDISFTINYAKNGLMHRKFYQFYPHSFGQFYTALTQYLGFKGGRHEGKITGLSAFGKFNHELMNAVKSTLIKSKDFKLNKKFYSEGFIRNINFTNLIFKKKPSIFNEGFGSSELSFDYFNYKKPLKKLLKNFSREDLAYTYQYILEKEMGRITKKYLKQEKISSLCLAGGVLANVKLNQSLSRQLNLNSIFVFPNMGDGGLSVGAALALKGHQPTELNHVYLGENFTNDEILNVLNENKNSLHWTIPKNLEKVVAKLLMKNKIIARFDGKMEFGPRALGNRSILYNCSDYSVNEWLNKKLKRSEFMPFAPICVYEDNKLYFDVNESERKACEFMTIVVNATDRMKKLCPAAVHIDGSCRPQFVKKNINPKLHKLILEYKKLTGISCLINTSFNMHEEPIVNLPKDAVKAFLSAELDYLVIEDYLVTRTG